MFSKVIAVALISLLLYNIYFKEKRPSNFQEFKDRKFYQSYSTWDKCFPKQFLQPKTTEEIIKIVQNAIINKHIIKIVGSGHSLNCKKKLNFLTPKAIGMTNDVLLNLNHYNKVLNIDKEHKTVTFEAGIRLKDLNKILDENGLALANLGGISEQSFSGAITTATHGTSVLKNGRVVHGSLSTFIQSFEIIDGNGVMHFASKEKNSDLFHAGRVSLGALGIITKLTVQCVDSFNIEKEEFLETVPEAMSNIEKYWNENDFVKYWYFPFAEKVRITTYKKTEKEISIKSTIEKIVKKFETPVFLNILYLGQFIGAPLMHKIFGVMMSPRTFEIAKSYRTLSMEFDGGVDQPSAMEYMIPIEKFKPFHEEFRKYLNSIDVQTNFWNEIRFIRKDDENWLSPFQVDSVSFDIGLHNQIPEQWKKFHLGAEEIFKKYGGRAHWGKTFTKTKEELKKDYPKFVDFQNLRKKMDPQGIFYNRFLKDIFE